MQDSAQAGIAAPGSTRWFPALLAAAMAIPSLATFAVGALGPSIVADLAMSRTQLGLVGSVVSATAVGGSLVLGRFVDGFGSRPVMFGLLTGSALSIVLLSTAPLYAALLVMGVLAGLAQACANPVTNALIAQFAPVARRGTILGIKQSGVQMGQLVVGLVLPSLAVLVGWRTSTSVLLLPILGVAAWSYRSLPRTSVSSRDIAARTPPTPAQIASRTDLIWLCAYTFLLALSIQPMNIYLPLYAYETELLSLPAAGSAVGLVGALGIAARILAGRLVSHLATPSRCLAPLALTAALAMACMALASTSSVVLLWVGIVLFAASALSGNVLIMLTLIKRVDMTRTGHASGLVSAAMFVGFAVGPAGFGLLVDATDSYTRAWGLVGTCCVIASLVGAIIYHRRGSVVPIPS